MGREAPREYTPPAAPLIVVPLVIRVRGQRRRRNAGAKYAGKESRAQHGALGRLGLMVKCTPGVICGVRSLQRDIQCAGGGAGPKAGGVYAEPTLGKDGSGAGKRGTVKDQNRVVRSAITGFSRHCITNHFIDHSRLHSSTL